MKLNHKKRKTVYFYSVKGIIQYEPIYMLNYQRIRKPELRGSLVNPSVPNPSRPKPKLNARLILKRCAFFLTFKNSGKILTCRKSTTVSHFGYAQFGIFIQNKFYTMMNNLKSNRLFLVIPILFLLYAGTIEAQGPLMRFPDIHEDLIVFVHGEDIWSVAAEGG